MGKGSYVLSKVEFKPKIIICTDRHGEGRI